MFSFEKFITLQMNRTHEGSLRGIRPQLTRPSLRLTKQGNLLGNEGSGNNIVKKNRYQFSISVVKPINLEQSYNGEDYHVHQRHWANVNGARWSSVPRLSLAAHFLKRHFSDAVLPMLADHSTNRTFLLHHFVITVSEPGQPGFIPREITVADQWII